MNRYTFKHRNYAAYMIVEAISETAAWSYMRSLTIEPDKWKITQRVVG